MGSISYQFEGETVIVTGGSSGIGRAIATRFGEAGATVLIADICEEPRGANTTPTHELIERNGGRATFVDTDVSDPKAVSAVVAAARGFGGVDVMINNAARYHQGDLVDVDFEAFRETLDINVGGVFVGCQAAARDMIDRGVSGTIINTASISAIDAQPGQSVYSATKGALRMITRVVAAELAEHEIRVNAVAPGIIATQFGSTGARRQSVGWQTRKRRKRYPSAGPASPRTSRVLHSFSQARTRTTLPPNTCSSTVDTTPCRAGQSGSAICRTLSRVYSRVNTSFQSSSRRSSRAAVDICWAASEKGKSVRPKMTAIWIRR